MKRGQGGKKKINLNGEVKNSEEKRIYIRGFFYHCK